MAENKPTTAKNEKFYRNEVKKDYTPCSGTFPGFSYGANSITGWRLAQEDRYDCLPRPDFIRSWSYFGVYDGHGGEEVAEYLRRKLHVHIMEQLAEFGDIKIALCEGFKACDRAVKDMKLEELAEIKESLTQEFSLEEILTIAPGERKRGTSAAFMYSVRNEVFKEILRMQLSKVSTSNGKVGQGKDKKKFDEPLVGLCVGSTATVVVFTDEIIYIANVGDSRCIGWVDGKIKNLSRDHRPAQKKERDRIVEAGHKVSKGRINGGLNMSRAFGDFALKRAKVRESQQALIVEPFLCALEINSELDFIVIASDGIWNSMGNEAVMDFIRQRSHLPIPDVCQQLFEDILARENGRIGLDNMTMIIIRNDSNVKPENMKTKEREAKKTDKKPDGKKPMGKKEAKKSDSKKPDTPKPKRLRK